MLWHLAAGLGWLLHSTSAYTQLSEASLRSIPGPGKDFDIKEGKLLAPILIPRVPGSAGSTAVLTHFVDFFQQSLPAWNLTFQNSTSTTPTSNGEELPFVNLIATRDPPWAGSGQVGRLALVAHYDSKLTPEGFIGATDSAAPCAMIMHAARSLDQALTEKWAATEKEAYADGLYGDLEEHKGVQILLLDGEEAFLSWTDTDSLYGARSLAEEWEQTLTPAGSTYRSSLDSIDLFVLLDLLGAANPTVPSYFKTTHWAYQYISDVESRLRSLGILKTPSSNKFLPENKKKETDRWLGGLVGDDHVPFMEKGVEVLHLIAAPFPHVWHTIDDDGEHLDMNTVEDWAMIVTAFAAEWLELDKYMGTGQASRRGDSNEPVLESHDSRARDELSAS